MFISIEGIDGCGKTTLCNKLSEYLTKKNIDHIKTLEPGGTLIANQIREILLHSEGLDLKSEILLFLAARAQHVSELIKPALDEGKWVITDRYSDSFLAYQAYGRGFDFDFLNKLNNFACYNLYPDKTFYLKIDVKTSLARQTDPDRISSSDVDFYKRIKLGFDELSQKFSDRFEIIDATQSIEKVFQDILKELNI
ncbi:MAG: dTMP kinase [Abditibacteriota bacterium]|nr:dTMP kinase [Abditibacteriota bacterium]